MPKLPSSGTTPVIWTGSPPPRAAPGDVVTIIHAAADDSAGIRTERYNQTNAAPDNMTMSTGDAGKRVACGVVGAG